uniref:BPTI/Kunitz inhibitor domain-containing protein n=1 Tax=Glossina austeni TaxID=7395 RepID=A0A1A9V0W7_GLOAU
MKLFTALLVVIVALISLTSVAAFKDAICALPGGANGDGKIACLAYIPSWSYRAGTNECVQFVYSGCGGNENRFSTQYECENKCKE